MKISHRKKRKEDDEVCKMTCNIPNEMVIEILRRVPCEDLVENLKLVCKKWYSIIYNGSFAYLHFEHKINKSSSFSQLKALVISTSNGKSVTISSLEWHNNNFLDKPFENLNGNRKELFTVEYTSGIEVRIDQMSFHKANCVNGFVCFWSNRHAHFHICNSMSMEYVTIPPNPYWSSNRDDDQTIVGLGFCPISYEYKLVIFQVQYRLNVSESEKIKGSISTINRNDKSWRPLKWNDHSHEPCGRSAACVNGMLYWNTQSVDNDILYYDSTILLAFDVAKEESYFIEVPIQSQKHNVSIEEKGGKICLTTSEMCFNTTHILFKGYIAHNNDDLESLNSWRLEFNVTIYDIYGDSDDYHTIFTNEILIVDTYDTISFFDVATGRLLDQFRTSIHTASTLFPYVPSLIPLHHRPIRENFYLDAVGRL